MYQAQVVMSWEEMLAFLPGIHGLCPHHVFSCPTTLLPAGSCLRSVSVPEDKEARAASEIHANKSLFLNPKNTLPVLCHSLLMGFTLFLSHSSLSHAGRWSSCSRVVRWFCLVLCCRQGSPEPAGAFRLTGMQRSMVEEEGNSQQNRMRSAKPDFSSRFEVSSPAIHTIFGWAAEYGSVTMCGMKGAHRYFCSFWWHKPKLYSRRKK